MQYELSRGEIVKDIHSIDDIELGDLRPDMVFVGHDQDCEALELLGLNIDDCEVVASTEYQDTYKITQAIRELGDRAAEMSGGQNVSEALEAANLDVDALFESVLECNGVRGLTTSFKNASEDTQSYVHAVLKGYLKDALLLSGNLLPSREHDSRMLQWRSKLDRISVREADLSSDEPLIDHALSAIHKVAYAAVTDVSPE